MSERAKKVAELQEKISSIELYLNDMKKKHTALTRELWVVEKTMEVGDLVKIEETCQRGCCIEFQFSGRVIEVDDKGWYVLQNDSGKTYRACPSQGDRVK